MSPQLVGWIFTGLGALIIVLSVLIGALRGLKKSTHRLIWVFVWGVVCLLVSGVIAKALVNIDISFLHLSVNGTEVSTLPQYIQKTVEASSADMAQLMADNPKVMELCTTIATLLLNLVVFEILFWLTKWILWPVWAILYHCIFGKKQSKSKSNYDKVAVSDQGNGVNKVAFDKKAQTATVQPKPKKHAGYGALVGLAMGLLVCMLAFVPISGISNALIEIDNQTQTKNADGTTTGLVTNALGNNAVYLTSYKDSVISNAFTYTGMAFVQNGIGSMLTTAKFDGQKISLNDEISTFAPIYTDYVTVSAYDYSALTQQDLDELLLVAEDMVNRALSSGIVQSLYSQIAPYIAKNILTNENYFIQLPKFNEEYKNQMLKDMVRVFFGITESNQIDTSKLVAVNDVKTDLNKLIGVLKKLNDAKILVEIVTNNVSMQTLQSNLSAELANQIVDDVFDMKTIGTLVPVAIEPSVKMIVESLPSFDYNGQTITATYTKVDGGVTTQGVKNLLKNIATNGVPVLKGYNQNNTLYLDGATFSNIGAIIDYAKIGDVISDQTFKSILNYGTNYAHKFVDEQNFRTEISNIISAVIDTVNDVDSFGTELGYFGGAYKIYEAHKNMLTPTVICNALDVAKQSIFYTKNIDTILSNGSDFACEEITSNNLPLDTTDLDKVVKSIKDVDSFNAEYTKIKGLYNFIYDLYNTGNISTELLKEKNLVLLGENLDTAIQNGSVILADANCKIIIKDVLAKMDFPTDFADSKAKVISNVDNVSNYKTEFEAVAKALKIDDINNDSSLSQSQKFVKIGQTLDQIKVAKLFDGAIAPAIKKMLDGVTLPSDLSDVMVKQNGQDINILQAIKNNVDFIDSYETELDVVGQVIKIQDITETGKQKFVKIGEILNKAKTSALFGDVCAPIVQNYIDKQLQNSSLSSSKKDIVKSIKNNVTNSIDYQTELGYLSDFVDADFDSISNFKTYLQQNLIDSNGASKSKIVTTSVIYDMVIDMSGSVSLNGINISGDLVDVLNKDKQDGANIIDVLAQLDGISAEYNNINSVPEIENITKDYLSNLGTEIDNLTSTYSLVINGSAKAKIGDYVASQINSKVQNKAELPDAQKQAVKNTYDGRAGYSSYNALLTQFATDLGLWLD